MTARITILFRALRLSCHLAYGMALAAIFPLFRLPMQQAILKRWSAELLEILHVRLETSGQPPAVGRPGLLLVANHISWLDVLAINAVRPSCFIAKSEVSGWPLIGMLCRRTRTIFIERDIRRDTMRINTMTGAMLDAGETVVLFPEGTSTDGSQLRHFHSSLFQCAIDHGTAVLPVALRYHDGSGAHCSDAAFVGDMNFLESLLKILSSPSLHVSLTQLQPLATGGKNRRMLAAESQAAICNALEAQRTAHSATASPAAQTGKIFRSAYSLLLDPVHKLRKRHSG